MSNLVLQTREWWQKMWKSLRKKSSMICENMFTKTTIIGQLLLYLNIHPRPQEQERA